MRPQLHLVTNWMETIHCQVRHYPVTSLTPLERADIIRNIRSSTRALSQLLRVADLPQTMFADATGPDSVDPRELLAALTVLLCHVLAAAQTCGLGSALPGAVYELLHEHSPAGALPKHPVDMEKVIRDVYHSAQPK